MTSRRYANIHKPYSRDEAYYRYKEKGVEPHYVSESYGVEEFCLYEGIERIVDKQDVHDDTLEKIKAIDDKIWSDALDFQDRVNCH